MYWTTGWFLEALLNPTPTSGCLWRGIWEQLLPSLLLSNNSNNKCWLLLLLKTGTFSLIRSSAAAAAAAAKSFQLCPTLCDLRDGSTPGSLVSGILQGRTLEWAAISFSKPWKWKVKVKSLSRVQLLGPHELQPTGLLYQWEFPGKSTGVGCVKRGKLTIINQVPGMQCIAQGNIVNNIVITFYGV